VCWVLRKQSYDIMRNLKAEESSKYLIRILHQGKQSGDKAWCGVF